MGKKVWESKTLAFGFLTSLLGVLGSVWPNANFALTWLNANGATVMMVMGFAGMGLRMITKDKVQLFGE